MVVFEIRKDGEFVGAFRIKDVEDFKLYEVVGDLHFDSISEDEDIIGTNEKKLVFEIMPMEKSVMLSNDMSLEKNKDLMKQLDELEKVGGLFV